MVRLALLPWLYTRTPNYVIRSEITSEDNILRSRGSSIIERNNRLKPGGAVNVNDREGYMLVKDYPKLSQESVILWIITVAAVYQIFRYKWH